MAAFFVHNRSNPQPSVHRAGIRFDSTATDAAGDAVKQYAAAHPVSAGDVLEVVSANAFAPLTAAATVVFSPAPSAPLPAIGS